MSYLVLARKSRPQTFEEVVGQKPVVKTLQNSLKRNRVAHAILFSGVRGVGKTTLARLMAKALNCMNGPTPVPCNQCTSCSGITSGSALDLYEIDGASNRGIQEVRELKEKLKFMPASSSFKIVIIDEVHMLTTEAFNALLKTLEEPPAHVYFLFATTELHKIPITILSRCQRFELQRVQSGDLAAHFTRLAANENITIDKGALSLIVREAEGSVRDGLSLLDQVFSYGESPITVEEVVDVLGLVNRDVLNNIVLALLQGDKAKALASLDETFKFGMDIKRFITDLLDCFRSLLLIKIGDCDQLLDLPDEDLKVLHETAENYAVETIHQKLNLLMQAAEDIRFSLQPKLVLETSFLSIIESGNVIPVASLLSQLDQVIEKLPKEPATVHEAPPADAHENLESKKKIADFSIQEQPKIPPPPEPLPKPDPVADSSPPWGTEEPPPEFEHQLENSTSTTVPEEKPVAPSQKTDQRREIRKDWLDFIAYLKELKPWMAQNLQQASEIKDQGQELLLEFVDSNDYTLLRTVENRKVLTEYILDFFQKDFVIHFVTPAESDDPDMKASEGPKKQRQKLASHPLVMMTEEIFGGQVGDIRIGSKSR
jgi:DNA polymerase-3 subunit gamma/tau